MATATDMGCIEQIGETAGAVWRTLEENGPISVTRLVKLVEAPRDTVMQAMGWLAREGKLEIEETNRGRIVSLKSSW